jgi:phosphoribosylformylglycinamidine synthase
VSLYNETDGRPILPTPTVAAVGLIASPDDIVTQSFKRAGDVVVLLGVHDASARSLGGSEYLCRTLGRVSGGPPVLDLAAEVALQRLVLELARAHVLESAHDVSDGGLAIALAECCSTGPEDRPSVGARIDLDAPPTPFDLAALFYGEAPSRIVVSVRRENMKKVLDRAGAASVPARELGVTGGESLSIGLVGRHGDVTGIRPGALIWRVREIREARERCLEGIVGPD